MLRYYEQAGLIKSLRKEDYAYRVYDKETLLRLRQIIVFRKLRLSVKQISEILNNPCSKQTADIFMQNMAELDAEINALTAIRKILNHLADEFQKNTNILIDVELLDDSSVVSIVDMIPFTKNHIKETVTVNDLKLADTYTQKYSDVRVIYLPPMTVAAAYVRGAACEGKARTEILRFVRHNKLLDAKPDARCFGIGCDDVDLGDGGHYWRYEFCVSIPEHMDVPEPLVKKKFIGGLYTAYPVSPHTGSDWDESWGVVMKWLAENGKYQGDHTPRFMPHGIGIYTGGMEEILNLRHVVSNKTAKKDTQFDLLAQIKE
jgi:DNA-binding transcriptional MerR regulator/DNA gyrase inhibitor GyrI